MEMSKEFIRALGAVSQDVAADLDDEGRSDPLVVAEVTMDANRLQTWGFPAAQQELQRLLEKHSWDEVLHEAAKHVATD